MNNEWTKILPITVLTLVVTTSCQTTSQPATTTGSARILAQPANEIVTGKGNRYRLIATTEQDAFQEHESRGLYQSRSYSHLFSFRPSSVDDVDFEGNDRMAAKTSLANAPVETFQNLQSLLATLPSDDEMMERNPPISKDSSSNRVAEENRNVVVNAYIFASKFESDNDFHVIIGSGTRPSGSVFMNVEISGLPPSGPDRTILEKARKDFLAFFQDSPPTASGYKKIDPPVPVQLSGSLFYDIDHKPGAVGPAATRPKTAWEIHPVNEITFEP